MNKILFLHVLANIKLAQSKDIAMVLEEPMKGKIFVKMKILLTNEK
tara:strand:- start:48 stop:185 length:138 start_codon:yes stop_codon:yes gene_type:complete